MKKIIFLSAILITSFFSLLHAQVYEKKTVHAGESLSDLSYYLFPSFKDAEVKFKKGGELSAKMNFNLLICQMQFIDPHGDTLNIAKPQDIYVIDFDSSSFFYDKGYCEILETCDSIELAVLRKVTYEPIKIGALGLRNHSGTGTENYTSFLNNASEKQLTVNEDIDIEKETTFFLIPNNKEMIKATKPGFLKVFPQSSQFIQTYIKENKPVFNKESDLKKLFVFCKSLASSN